MIVAITGGTGFIGSQLVRHHLQLGHKIRILTRRQQSWDNRLDIFQADLIDNDHNLSRFVDNVDILYHCAAETNNEDLMQKLHVDGTNRLIGVAEGNVGRWIQLSSVGVYGTFNSGIINEGSQYKPIGEYETTKLESDRLLISKKNSHGMEFVILHPSIVFGKSMSNQSLSQMCQIIKRGWFFYIGKPGAMVNYVHVDDVVNALYICATHKNAGNKSYILSRSVSLEEMVEAFARGLSAKNPKLRIPKSAAQVLVKLFARLPAFPLNEGRLRALTGSCVYDGSAICRDLGFEYRNLLVSDFEQYANQLQL